ncbi:aspartyl protease AED3-like [Papaver somniferum]|uniref:aspartyl protease AED3-like n=1 Tax=Papaver somniferum TaxID=3469 RepID=UPI000E6FD95A|nr:aspartyl protease AED3-like [Papaver somniferum]
MGNKQKIRNLKCNMKAAKTWKIMKHIITNENEDWNNYINQQQGNQVWQNDQPFSSSRPRGLVFPVHKDPATLQYATQISLGTTRVPVNFVVDLGGKVSWIHSKGGCSTSLYSPVDCKSPQCSLARKSASPVFCVNNTCSLYAANLITHSATNADLVSGVVTVQPSAVIDPKTGDWISVPNVTARKFPFGCETTIGLLEGLPKGVKGMVSLGRSTLALASQFSAAFRFPRKFAPYLSSADNGFVFFGDEPYIIPHSGWQLMSSLSYTPLLLNPMPTESWSTAPNSDYYIDVKSIEIDGEVVRLNKALLSINKTDGV